MPTLLIEHGGRPGASGILGETLREYGHRMRVVRVAPARGAADDLPPDLDDIDGIVLSDGPQSLAQGALPAWVDAESRLLQAAERARIPIVGLGFGARLYARAAGGEIRDVAIGWRTVALTPVGREDPIYKGVPWTLAQACIASESIASLPKGAQPLATARDGGGERVVAFSAGVYSFLFEHGWWLDDDLFERCMTELASDSPGAATDDLRRGWARDGAASMRVGRRIAESIALYLLPVDRANAGRVKDLHY